MIETCEQITAAEDQLIITIALVRRLATAAKSRPPDNESGASCWASVRASAEALRYELVELLKELPPNI